MALEFSRHPGSVWSAKAPVRSREPRRCEFKDGRSHQQRKWSYPVICWRRTTGQRQTDKLSFRMFSGANAPAEFGARMLRLSLERKSWFLIHQDNQRQRRSRNSRLQIRADENWGFVWGIWRDPYHACQRDPPRQSHRAAHSNRSCQILVSDKEKPGVDRRLTAAKGPAAKHAKARM